MLAGISNAHITLDARYTVELAAQMQRQGRDRERKRESVVGHE